MDAYRALVRRLAEKRDPEIISNSSIDHAGVLVAEMLRLGSGEARIFSGGLNPGFYSSPEVVASMGTFLSSPKTMVKIVVQDKEKASTNWPTFFSKIKECADADALNRIEIRVAGQVERALPFHFTTVGEEFFRFEPNREKHEAFASFGRADHVKRLTKAFDAIWAKSTVFECVLEPAMA